MQNRIAEIHEVKEAERQTDSEFRKLPFPHTKHPVSKWHLLTAFEDGLRNTLWTLTRNLPPDKINVELSGFMLLLDRFKYSLRYGLERIYLEQPATDLIKVERQIIPTAYEAAAKFIQFGDDYLLASRAFGSFHAGNARAFHGASRNLLILKPPIEMDAYCALDLFIHSEQESGIPINALITAFMWPKDPALQIDQIIQRTRYDGTNISYYFDPLICNHLMKSIPQPETIVPDRWQFPWGTSSDSHRVFEALQARCLQHLLSIHFGAIHFGVQGFGLTDICPLFSKTQLVSELSEVSGIKQAVVSLVIEALSYGSRTDTPDPALQPLIPFSEDIFAAPSLLILSSCFPRNYLSLHARVESRSFDKQSCLFEVGMSNYIEAIVRARFSKLLMHTYLPGRKDVGEVDLLVVDNKSRTIIVGEFRWLLQPGDPREVNNRKKVCAEKVLQLSSKIEAAHHLVAPILKVFGLEADPQLWNVLGIVIVQGYVAAGPEPERLPVVPTRVFELGLNHFSDLRTLHRWLASRIWMPQQDSHFVSVPVTAKFGKQRLQWRGFHIRHDKRYLPDYIVESAASFQNSEL